MLKKCPKFALTMQYAVFDHMEQCGEADVQRLLQIVPVWRREKALRYRAVFGQWTCLKAYELLLELMAANGYQLPSCDEWKYNEYGKPMLENGPYFSISHCREAVAVAIDHQPIGIDVESIRTADVSLVERTMNKDEQKRVEQSADSARTFIRLWTQKEAVLKCQGTGIVDDLHQVLTHTDGLQICTRESEKYILSICHS